MVPTSSGDKDLAGLGLGTSVGGLLIQRVVPERAIMGSRAGQRDNPLFSHLGYKHLT